MDIEEYAKIEKAQKNKLSEKLKHFLIKKFYHIQDKLFGSFHRCRRPPNFTIISNNCWGGVIYEFFNLQKLTPTVGLYFFTKDYLKFLKNLDYYLTCELKFIKPEESKYYKTLKIKGHTNKPIGILDDVEIVFLHYHSEEEAESKWTRRKERINKDNLIIKFSEQNYCEKEDIEEFIKLPYKEKICFVKNNNPATCCIRIPFYSQKISVLEDIPDYRLVMKKVRNLINI